MTIYLTGVWKLVNRYGVHRQAKAFIAGQVKKTMNQTVNVTGIVLSSAPVGDYDKRIVMLTKERGKISAFAKGARKTNSTLLAATNPFSFGEFVLYEGRTSYNMMHASVSNYFMELRSDFSAACYGSYFMEFADYYTRENNDEMQMLKLLYQSLRALGKKTIQKELIRYIFELKAFVVNGEYPQVFSCAGCGSEEGPYFFSAKENGILCKNCKKAAGGILLDESVLYTMQYIITSPIEKLYTFTVTKPVLRTLKRVMESYIDEHVDRPFKSLEVLNVMMDGV